MDKKMMKILYLLLMLFTVSNTFVYCRRLPTKGLPPPYSDADTLPAFKNKEQILEWAGTKYHILDTASCVINNRDCVVLLGTNTSGFVSVVIYIFRKSDDTEYWSLIYDRREAMALNQIEVDQEKEQILFKSTRAKSLPGKVLIALPFDSLPQQIRK